MASYGPLAALMRRRGRKRKQGDAVSDSVRAYSRFGRFISRLCPNKFPVPPRREFVGKMLIARRIPVSDQTTLPLNRKIPGYFPGSREFGRRRDGQVMHREAMPRLK